MPCPDYVIDALSCGARKLGLRVTPTSLANSAKRVLLGHAMIVQEMTPGSPA